MGTMNNKRRYLKHVAVLLAVVFLITAALMLVEVWDSSQGRFSGEGKLDSELEYKGEKYSLKENIDTLLVLGLDKFEGDSSSDSYNNDKQADFLMLVVFDNDAKTFSILHINRDTMAKVRILAIDETKVVDTVTKQIALAHTYGKGQEASCRNTKDSVEDVLLGVNIEHYISFTMDSVAAMNDFVGGVEVTVLDDFTGIDEALVKGEKVTLVGDQALTYIRTRYGLEDSSNKTRMVRQQQYVEALYEKAKGCLDTDEEFVIKLVDTMDDYVVYDSSDQRIKSFAEKFEEYEFLGIRELEGELKVGDQFVEFYPDEDSVYKNVIELFYDLKD